MAYKNFNFQILFRVTIVVLLTVGSTLAYLYSQWVIFAMGTGLLLITTYRIVNYFNAINRKLAFFFDSIRNEDSTLHFPEGVRSQSVKKLHESLNSVNKLISEIKIRNAHRERFFIEFMKHSTSGLVAVDEKGYVEIVNDAALQLFNTAILVHIDRLKQINNELFEAMMALQPHESKTTKVLVNDELHIVLIKMVKLKFGENEYSLYSLSDIKTELDEKEMDTWQKLIRILTHEIMNSIAPISSISDTLLNYFKNGKKISAREIENVEHGLEVINERSKGLIHFVDNYRKLSKVPKPVFKEIELHGWLESIGFMFSERAAKEGIDLEIKNEFSGSFFLGDQKLLTQVVLNLLNNAADALKETLSKKLLIHITNQEQQNISLKFIDNGPGISPENLDQIFIPFYTTKDNGSGIGLSLSRQIMKLHRGQLTARSVPGKETVFEMRL